MSLLHWSLARFGSVLGPLGGGGRPVWQAESIGSPEDSERAVEVPWATSAIASCVGFWLDIGYAFAESRYWESIPVSGWRRLLRFGYGLDVAEAQNPNPLDAEITGDVRDYDFDSLPRLALITCISTLEHIGCDNTVYNEAVGRDEGAVDVQRQVVARLTAALTRGGRLLISVPFGAFEDHGWFLQYNDEMVKGLAYSAQAQRGTLSSERYYTLDDAGWKRSAADQMGGLAYKGDEHRASGVALLEFCRQ